jgi:hypothetical protein
MGWVRVSDDFYDNPKMLDAGSVGRDLYWHGMAFCNRNLTDGRIPMGRALTLVDYTDAAVLVGNAGVDGVECAPIAVERLLDAGLWHANGHDCPECAQPGPRHYIVHDYLKYQPSRGQIEKKAEETRQRVAAWRESQKPNASCNSVTNAVRTHPVTHSVHHTPNPNPTPSNSLVTKGGEVALVDAREPRPTCSKHEENSETACRACKRRREWDDNQQVAEASDELEAKRRSREMSENCRICQGTNWIPDTDPAIKCNHESQGVTTA